MLLLAPSANDARVTAEVLAQARLQAHIVTSSQELCERLLEGCGAIALAEEVLAPANTKDLMGLLARQPAWSDLPIVLVASRGAEGAQRMRRLAMLGDAINATVLERPFRPSTLISAVEVALRSRHRQYQVRRLLTELGEARDTAEAASRAKDDFLATLSHELRTPLNPVLLISSEAANDESLPAGVRRDFDQIVRGVQLEARLIDDLLDLTRVARGKLSLDLRTVDLHESIRQAMQALEPDFNARGIAVVLALHAQNAEMRADPVRLQQVLWNILKNAAKFTPDRGRIEVRTASADGLARIQIHDTGVGMTPDELARIFDAFAQGEHARPDSKRKYGGLGLGLAISRQLITLHGGEITAESDGPGLGSTFTITLPLTRETRPQEDAPARAAMAPHATGTRFHRALLVEDHLATRISLARILERRGLEVETAGSLAEARTALRDGNFDLLISDIGLPDGSGHELMSELRERSQMRGIALSGYGMDTDIAQSREHGFSAHLTKPIDIRALDNAIAHLA